MGDRIQSNTPSPVLPSDIPSKRVWQVYGPMSLRELLTRIELRVGKRVDWLISGPSGAINIFRRDAPPSYIDKPLAVAVSESERADKFRRTATRDGNVISFKPICEECENASLLEPGVDNCQSHQICQHFSADKSSKTTKVAVNNRMEIFGRRAKRSRKTFTLGSRIRLKALCQNADGEQDSLVVVWSPDQQE
uniref:Uncharacterized protein n=1 Tax=Meloidogyne enterolobii TaxID=390850 RepID=A0A6V7X9E1_MELEN|nr:unnamed protein product [Meloidogyne enterolobii]